MNITQIVAIGLGLVLCAIPAIAFPSTRKAKFCVFLLAIVLVALTVWSIILFPQTPYASLSLFILPLGPILLTIGSLIKRGKTSRIIGIALSVLVAAFFSYAALAVHMSNANYAWEGMAHLPTFVKGQQAVRESLNDPDSAVFKDLMLQTYHSHPYMCGEVNARNRMGGMGGFTRFYVQLDEAMPFAFFDNHEDGSFNKYMTTCYGDDWDKDFKK